MKKLSWRARAKKIKAIISDVDGVLTDGGIVYGASGLELKRFHVRDGLAVSMAKRAGIAVFLVSGRTSEALKRRSSEIGVERLWQGVTDKVPIFDIIKKEYRLNASAICSIGDDLPDLPLFRRSGLKVAVPGAPAEVIRSADIVTAKRGGDGVLREVVDMILKAQGAWRGIYASYTS